jgi:hypothetical protein
MFCRTVLTLLATGGLFAVVGCSSSSSQPQFEAKGGATMHERPLQPLDGGPPKGGTPKPKTVD